MFTLINFSPFATNVLDCINRTDLVTRTGYPVRLEQTMNGLFRITIDTGKIDGVIREENLSNVAASYLLNSYDIGFYRRIENGVKVRSIPGGKRKLEEWTGTIVDAGATNIGYRYDVIPDANYPAKRPLSPGSLVHLYSGELVEVL